MKDMRCKRCGEYKPYREFPFGFQPCKECRKELQNMEYPDHKHGRGKSILAYG